MDGFLECPLCLQTLIEPLTEGGGHTFCRPCLLGHATISPSGHLCPMCRAPVTVTDPTTYAVDAEVDGEIRARLSPDVLDARRTAAAEIVEELKRANGWTLPIHVAEEDARHPVGAPISWFATEAPHQALIKRASEGSNYFLFCAGAPCFGKPAVVVQVLEHVVLYDGAATVASVCGVKEVYLGKVMAEEGPGGLPSTRVYFNPSKHDVPAQQLWGQHIAETPSWLDDPRGSFQSELNEMYQQEMHDLSNMDAQAALGVTPA